MKQQELFALELTDQELETLNALLREIVACSDTHMEFFEFEPGCFVAV